MTIPHHLLYPPKLIIKPENIDSVFQTQEYLHYRKQWDNYMKSLGYSKSQRDYVHMQAQRDMLAQARTQLEQKKG